MKKRRRTASEAVSKRFISTAILAGVSTSGFSSSKHEVCTPCETGEDGYDSSGDVAVDRSLADALRGRVKRGVLCEETACGDLCSWTRHGSLENDRDLLANPEAEIG